MTGTETAAMVGFAFGTGTAAFFAPCAYPLLPGYAGYYVNSVDRDDPPVGGALLRGLAASAGILVVFGGVAAVVTVVGSVIVSTLPLIEPGVGVVLIVLGALVLAGYSPGWHTALPRRRRSVVGFAAFGGLYALAATGCTVPVFLAVVVKAITLPVVECAAVIVAYATGMGLLMTSATVAIAVGHDTVVERVPRYTAGTHRVAGAIILVAGVGQVSLSLVGFELP